MSSAFVGIDTQPSKGDIMKDKDAYIQKLHARLDKWNADIDKLRARADKMATESTTTRKAGGLDFRPEAGKIKARQCFNRCGCNRVQSTRFENNQSGPDYQRQMEKLNNKHREAEQLMAKVREADHVAWEDLKSEVQAAWDAMEAAIRSAQSRDLSNP
jgi:hypothetical protein